MSCLILRLLCAGWSPLHEACNRGNYSVARLLIQVQVHIIYVHEACLATGSVADPNPSPKEFETF
jgi:Ankyrin repeat